MNNLEKLEFVMNAFSKRILPAYLFQCNPQLFLKWQGNICKQVAILGTEVIKHYMGEDYIKVEAWEGFFEHDKLGSYNHCWNYLIHKSDSKLNIICDFTSTISYMDYCEHNDPALHIGGNQASVNKNKIVMIGMEEIDVEQNLQEPEFYTGAKGEDLVPEIITLLNYAKLWDEKDSEEEFTEYEEV